jgi:LPS sulfotransferase NodH
MSGPFHSFVIFAEMRTGSNLLEANLNALEGVTSYGEVFNPHFIGKKNAEDLFGITLAAREANPRTLLAKLRSETPGLSGFRFFHDHDPRVPDLLLPDPACAKIILTRNPIDRYVSWKIARATGQWKLSDPKRLRTATAEFDETEFRDQLAATQAFQLRLLAALQTTGQTAFVLDYEDLTSLPVLNGLAAFLGVETRLKALDDTLKKQNPEPIEEKLDNPEALAPALARTDLFGLARTPVFEPRRPFLVQTAVAANAAPLLFFPISSAPDAEIRNWLADFGGVTEGFDQKTLRAWKTAHPGHRSFAVIRHPLLRAHVAFHDRIVSGKLANHRLTLIRAYKAKLPEPGEPFPSLEAEHTAFLIFLRYARLAVMGQVGQKVDSHWASQTTILQSLASFQPIDLVIREDRLPTSLAFLAAEAGVAAPPTPAPADVAALAAIHDYRLEHAAEAAYARDYMGFGFDRWRN